MRKRLLGVFAHPDDETFLAGPLLAKYCSAGVEVRLICATVAEEASESGVGFTTWTELQGAAQVLGISRIYGLGYSGSWMRRGASETRSSLAAVSTLEVADRIQEIMREFRPHVVVTDSAYGAYGHPDHILIHRAVTAAVETMAIEDQRQAPRLYALAYPLPLVRLWVRILPLFGVNTHRLAGRDDLDLGALAGAKYSPSVRIDVRPYVRHRKRASRFYASQIRAAPLPLRLLEALPIRVQEVLLGRVWLSRLHPPHTAAHPLDKDVFTEEYTP